MTEIIHEAFKGYNLPLTILLGLIALYWVISMFGLVDFDSVDNAIGLDGVDGDIHADLETASEGLGAADGHGHDSDHHHDDGVHIDQSPNAVQGMLRFLGASDAPIMFVLTVFSLYAWGGNLLANYYFNDGESTTLANLLLLGVVVASLILTKLTVRPLRPLMKSLRSSSVNKPVTGRTGLVRSVQLTQEYGQVEVIAEGASLLLNTRLSAGFEPLPRGTEVLIVSQDEDSDLYIARPVSADSINQPTLDT